MKALTAALALLLVPLALPTVHAQDAVSTPLATDNPGDEQVTVQGNSQPPPSGTDLFTPADLTGLTAQETPDNFVFTLAVANLAPKAEATSEGSTLYYIYFLQHDMQYRVRIQRNVGFANMVQYSAQLQGYDPGRGGYFSVGGALDVQADPTANPPSMAVTVPRQAMLDANGASPHPEIPLTGFHASSLGLASQNRGLKAGNLAAATATVTDFMPDQGNSTTLLPVHFGVVQTGHIRLSSEIPTRASNGEATTFVFQVQATNQATQPDTVTLDAGTPPAGWTVKLPATQVTIPGNGSVQMPVLVTTPFTHTHGAFQNFILRAKSINDPASVGAVQLGVRYTLPPQPAGHHHQIWLHSEPTSDDPTTAQLEGLFGGGAEAFMNAQQDDPNDKQVNVPGDNGNNFGVQVQTPPVQEYQWEVPLSPGLEMGLDFDITQPGALDLNFGSVAPVQGATVSGYLARYAAPNATAKPSFGPNGASAPRGALTVLADLTPMTKDLGAHSDAQGSAVLFQGIVVTPRPASDFVPFERGASMSLIINMTFTRDDAFLGAAAPVMAPGGSIVLPLNEYHDPVNDIFVSNVELVVTSPQDRTIAPGGTVLYNLTLANHGDQDATYTLEITGTNHEWAKLLPDTPTILVPAGGSKPFSVVVRVPADTVVTNSHEQDKTAADLVLSATNQGDFNQRALARLYTTVQNGKFQDDSDLVARIEGANAPKAKAPAPGIVLPALALVAVALALARRRKA